MKALVGAFNQEKALVGAFSVIVKTDCETDGALHSTTGYLRRGLAQGQAESELQGGGGPEDTAVTAAGSTATWSW